VTVNFEPSPKTRELQERLLEFMDSHIYPAEAVWREQVRESGDPYFHPPVMEELKREAQDRGLWNLFLPDERFGAGLTNLEYAPLAEIMGRSIALAPEATNCAAPDTGNMEVLSEFGSPDQQRDWLEPLLAGEIRSCFAMTEPEVASSDATNMQSRIERDGDSYVINGHKWWTSGAASDRCKISIFMGVTDPEAEPHKRHSMILVPMDTPGVEIVRTLPVFGYDEGHGGHCEVLFDDVRVPAENLIGGEGSGFAIAQARLGPGRIHHCMRAIGMAERAFDLMCTRAHTRFPFGKPLARQGVVRNWIAESRIEIEQVRLLVLKTAWLMDTVGNKGARIEISAIKVAAPEVALKVIDRAIQTHGGGGVSDDFPLAAMYAGARTLRIADGPDEVHKVSIARRELARYEQQAEPAPVA
jgi:acyl-CoA dehydrogenase